MLENHITIATTTTLTTTIIVSAILIVRWNAQHEKCLGESGSATAKNLVFHGKWAAADNVVQEFKLPGAGIYCNEGAYVDLTNCDFCYVIGTF